MPKQTVPVTSPIKGINRVVNREGQPPDTCWDALNMLPFDRFGRHRVSQRPGTSKAFITQMSGDTRVQGMLQVSDIVYAAEVNAGLTIPFTEPFTSLPEFQGHFGNVPSTVIPSGGTLTFPPHYSPSPGDQPFTYTPVIPATLMVYDLAGGFAATGTDGSSAEGITLGVNYAGTGYPDKVTSLASISAAPIMELDGSLTLDCILWAQGVTQSFNLTGLVKGSSYLISLHVDSVAGTATGTVNGTSRTHNINSFFSFIPYLFVGKEGAGDIAYTIT